MRISLLVLALVAAAAFVIGRASSPGAAPAATDSHVYSGQVGDVFRVPAAATHCLVSHEAGAVNTICRHTPLSRARYSVVFYRDNLLVYRNGNPDNVVFSAKGRP
jgi:hypothetical protein